MSVDLNLAITNLMRHDDERNVRPEVALNALVNYLTQFTPDVAKNASDYIVEQYNKGQLIAKSESVGRIFVVGCWNSNGMNFSWFKETKDAKLEWSKTKKSINKNKDCYAFLFTLVTDHLDVPDVVNEDIIRHFLNYIDDDETIYYKNGEHYKNDGFDDVDQKEADKIFN